MARYLVVDFETTGLGKDAANGHAPYAADRRPLPRPNYPVELAAAVVEADGRISARAAMLVRGAERLDPWVEEHCPHLSVRACERDGVEFGEALARLAAMAPDATLVAHNLAYDWGVIAETASELGLKGGDAFRSLQAMPRFCTCVNEQTKRNRTAYFFKRLSTWIGPNLGTLAAAHGVAYDASKAHGAAYDVEVTAGCLVKIKQLGA